VDRKFVKSLKMIYPKACWRKQRNLHG